MSSQNPSGLNENYRDCLRGETDHRHKSASTKTTHRSRIRERVFRTVEDGALLWHELPGAERADAFNRVNTVGQGPESQQKLDLDELDEARALRRGIVGWLAFLYAGSQDAKSVISAENIHFDFEAMLEEAVWKAESRDGRRVTNFSFEADSEPVPSSPLGDVDNAELLERFENGQMLDGLAIARLRQEGEITDDELNEYYDRLAAGASGFGVDEDVREAFEDAEE